MIPRALGGGLKGGIKGLQIPGLPAHLSIQEFEIKSRKMSRPDTPEAEKSTIDYETVRFGFLAGDGALFACCKVSDS